MGRVFIELCLIQSRPQTPVYYRPVYYRPVYYRPDLQIQRKQIIDQIFGIFVKLALAALHGPLDVDGIRVGHRHRFIIDLQIQRKQVCYYISFLVYLSNWPLPSGHWMLMGLVDHCLPF